MMDIYLKGMTKEEQGKYIVEHAKEVELNKEDLEGFVSVAYKCYETGYQISRKELEKMFDRKAIDFFFSYRTMLYTMDFKVCFFMNNVDLFKNAILYWK